MNTWPNDTFNYNRQSQLAVRNSYNSSQESQHQYNWNRYSQNTYPCSQEKISNMPREYQRSTYPDQGTDRHPLCRCPVSIVPEKQMNDPRKVIGPPNRTASSPGNPWPKITGVYTLNESGKEKEHSSHENNGVNNRNEGPINANTRNYPRENYLLEPPIIDKCPTSYELQHVQQMRYQQIQQERMAEQYRMEQSQYASQHGPRMPLSSPQIINSDPRIRASGPQFTQNFERMPHSSPQASQSIPRIPTSAVKSTVQRTGILESHLRQNVYRMPYTSQQANQQIPPKLSHPNFYPSRPQEMNKSYISNINQRQNQNQNNEKRLVCTCKTPWPTEKPIVRTANIMQPGSVTNLYREQYGTDTCSANHEFTRSRIRETLALRNTQKLLRSYRSESGPSLNVLKNVPSRNDSDNLPTPWSGCGNNNVERGHSFEIRKEKPFQRDGNPLIVNVDSVSQELSINGKGKVYC